MFFRGEEEIAEYLIRRAIKKTSLSDMSRLVEDICTALVGCTAGELKRYRQMMIRGYTESLMLSVQSKFKKHKKKVEEKEKDDPEETRLKAIEDASNSYINAQEQVLKSENKYLREQNILLELVINYENTVRTIDNNGPEEFKQQTNAIVSSYERQIERQERVASDSYLQFSKDIEMLKAVQSVVYFSEKSWWPTSLDH